MMMNHKNSPLFSKPHQPLLPTCIVYLVVMDVEKFFNQPIPLQPPLLPALTSIIFIFIM